MIERDVRAARALRLVVWASAVLVLSGCGNCGEDNDNNGDISGGGTGKLLTSPLRVAFAQVAVGAQADQALTLRNISSDPLTIFEVRFEPGEGGNIDDLSLSGVPTTPFVIEGQGSREVSVRYAPKSTTRGRGQIVLATSDPEFTRTSPRIVEVETLANTPRLQPSPASVRFTQQSTTAPAATQKLLLTNAGSAPLELLSAPEYQGGSDFSIQVPARTYPVILRPFDPDAAEASPRDYIMEVDVRYRALGSGADTGSVLVRSNDLRTPDPMNGAVGLSAIPILASSDAPCILIDSLARNLGQVPVGKRVQDLVRVENCGSQPLIIESVRLTRNSDDEEYELDLGDWDQDGTGDVDSGGVEIAPGESDTFTLRYTPTAEGTDQARIAIFSNDPVTPVQEVSVVGRGALGVCPEAVATGRVKGQGSVGRPSLGAAPLDYIILDGSGSRDEDGIIPVDEMSWQWEVLSKPADAIVQLTESSLAPGDPRYREVRLLLAGDYEFGLRVRDNQGFESCNQAVVSVTALPNQKILIELTWTNPEDPDESDTDGSDVDLHLVKMGPGRWFESPYDIYFRNPNSGPGSENNGIWNPESPSLDIDDTDGAGPENIQLDDPAACQWYAIGVHYYRQIFGTAFITVRVYIDQALVFEKLNVPMTRGGQFLDIGRIHWDSRQVLDVTQLYPAPPEGQPPVVSQSMAMSGLCSEQLLY